MALLKKQPLKSPSRLSAWSRAVGEGVLEYRINFGPGYRVYFGYEGKAIVILLAGGTKQRQQRDIAAAKKRWSDYKKRKADQ